MLLNFEASCSDENRLAAMTAKLCDELQQGKVYSKWRLLKVC